MAHFREVCAASSNPVLFNGDAEIGSWTAAEGLPQLRGVMLGRGFVRSLGGRPDAAALLNGYIDRSCAELSGDRPVLGRLKELLAYWREASPAWQRRWDKVKLCRTIAELRMVLGCRR